MAGLLGGSQGGTAARAAERAADRQRQQTEAQYRETSKRAELSEAESRAASAEMLKRSEAASTLQKNLQKLAQEQGTEVAEIVPGGAAQESGDEQKRKRKMPTLSSTLGIELT